MRTEDMEFILAVYQTRSISQAAARLNISPQGLGKAIRNVEQSLGCTLFQRTFQGVAPMPVCDAVITEITSILNASKKMEKIITDYQNRSDTAETILVMESVLGNKLEKIIEQYNIQYGKKLHIDLRPKDLEDNLELLFENEKFDYRVCTRELIRNDIYETFLIARLHFHPLVNKNCSLCRKTSIRVEDFEEMTLVVDAVRPYTNCFQELCRKCGFPLKVLECFDKFYLSRLLAGNSDYIYLGQRADIDRLMRLGDFVLLSMAPSFETHIVLQSRTGGVDPRLMNLIRMGLSSFSDQYLD